MFMVIFLDSTDHTHIMHIKAHDKESLFYEILKMSTTTKYADYNFIMAQLKSGESKDLSRADYTAWTPSPGVIERLKRELFDEEVSWLRGEPQRPK